MSMKFINKRSINKPEKVHVYIALTICQFQPYNVWILLKTVIKYLHWSICKTIQRLNHVTAGTEIHVHHVDPVYVHKFTCLFMDRIFINFMDILFHLISSELWSSGDNGGLVILRPCRLNESNPTVGKIFFVMFSCSVFLAAGLAAFKWNQAWHSSEVIGA